MEGIGGWVKIMGKNQDGRDGRIDQDLGKNQDF